jgi:hypothetical protein
MTDRDDEAFADARITLRGQQVAPAVYGAVLYLSVVVVLGEERPRPSAGEAAVALLATGLVYWLAHVFADLFPRIAVTGELHTRAVIGSMRRELPLLLPLLIPAVPLLAYGLDLIGPRVVYDLTAWGIVAALALLVIWLARDAGLGWMRTLWCCSWLLVVAAAVVMLKWAIH